jgi:hypothetical protein
MTKPEGPPVPDSKRMSFRVAAVVGAYLLYWWQESRGHLWAGVALAAGAIVLSWAAIDKLTRWRRERSELMEMAQILLGLGLIGLSVFLALK